MSRNKNTKTRNLSAATMAPYFGAGEALPQPQVEVMPQSQMPDVFLNWGPQTKKMSLATLGRISRGLKKFGYGEFKIRLLSPKEHAEHMRAVNARRTGMNRDEYIRKVGNLSVVQAH